MPIILDNVSYTYQPGTPNEVGALKKISLKIKSGQFIGIIGHTGSGKSTLIQHLNGLLFAQEGQITVDDMLIAPKSKDLKEIRRKVGLVFQYPEYQLFEDTVYKDISFGPRNMGLDEEEIDRRVREAAKMVELPDDLLDKSPFDLSGGEKRRAAVAGIMAMRPEVMILDEPTAGLDPKGRDTILSLIRQYGEQTGATMLFVSHSMEDIALLAQKVLVMNQGQAVMYAPTQEVFARARELRDMGLDVPAITQVFLGLRERGLPVREGIYTLDAGVEEIRRLRRERGRDRA